MSTRRIATPQDLGAAVRDARTDDGLTQAELAQQAGVSREWLIGLEQGNRPRAELTKILLVLAALNLPLVLQLSSPTDADRGDIAVSAGEGPSSADITRKAIANARNGGGGPSALGNSAIAAIAGSSSTLAAMNATRDLTPTSRLADLMPQSRLAELLPKITAADVAPNMARIQDLVRTSPLPQISPALLSYLQQPASEDSTQADGKGEDEEQQE